ncbi:LOW QUALITY PROTEIN: uncharacterized protein WCC33_000837 [Rhinophrynus dorsalis]
MTPPCLGRNSFLMRPETPIPSFPNEAEVGDLGRPEDNLDTDPFQGNFASQETSNNLIVDYPSLVIPTLVPGPSGDFHRFPSISHSFPSSSDEPFGSTSRSITDWPSSSHGMVDFRGPWCIEGFSESTKFLMSEAWAPGTKACYISCWSIWTRWCLERDLDPISTDLTNILNFLSFCFQQGKAYRTINCYRSTISMGHILVDNLPVGQHPLVCKLMKGIRLNRPPSCKYSTFWDVNLVLQFLESWPENHLLSLKQLSAKLTVLLCLISFRRVSDVRALDIRFRSFVPEGVKFCIFSRTKTLSREIVYPAFPQKPQLCVVQCLQTYELATSNLRSLNSHQLLLSFIKPHLPVSSTSLARWVRWVMHLAGIDTSFGAHSSRGAMASKSLMTGGRLEDILKAADWSRESTFRSFYFKPISHVTDNVIAQL